MIFILWFSNKNQLCGTEVTFNSHAVKLNNFLGLEIQEFLYFYEPSQDDLV